MRPPAGPVSSPRPPPLKPWLTRPRGPPPLLPAGRASPRICLEGRSPAAGTRCSGCARRARGGCWCSHRCTGASASACRTRGLRQRWRRPPSDEPSGPGQLPPPTARSRHSPTVRVPATQGVEGAERPTVRGQAGQEEPEGRRPAPRSLGCEPCGTHVQGTALTQKQGRFWSKTRVSLSGDFSIERFNLVD